MTAGQGQRANASRIVHHKAPKGSVLTLGDLRAFVADLDEAGAAESTPVDGYRRFRGGLYELKATAVRFGDAEER